MMLQKMKMNKILPVIFGCLLAIVLACAMFSLNVHAADLQTYDVYYPVGDGSWASYTFQIDPVDEEAWDYKNITINSSYVVFDGEIVCSFSESYRRYTTDASVLNGPSDNVNPAASGTLPAVISSESLYVIVYDPIIEDSSESWYFNFSYPNASGDMVQNTFYLSIGDVITIEPFGLFANGNELVSYPSCDSLAVGTTVLEYESAITPTYSLPYEFELSRTSNYFSVYNYIDNENVDGFVLDLYYPDSNYEMFHEQISLPAGTLLEFTETELWIVGHAEPLLVFDKICNAYAPIAMTTHNSSYIPTGSLPFEVEINEDMVYSVYMFEKVLSAPVIRYDSSTDTIKFTFVDEDAYYRAIIKYPDGTEQIRSIPRGYYEFAPYDVVDKVGEVTIFVQAFVTYDRYTTSSERSNGVFWTAAPPVIEEFYIEENMLHYKFSGTRAVGSIQQNGRTIVENIISGTYALRPDIYEINLSDGYSGFTLTVENKYGKIKSDLLEYYKEFANDKFGAFYATGVIFDGIIEMLEAVEIMGISLWMFLCTSFLITIIIPLICIIAIPSFGGDSSPRGGNDYSQGYARRRKYESQEIYTGNLLESADSKALLESARKRGK